MAVRGASAGPDRDRLADTRRHSRHPGRRAVRDGVGTRRDCHRRRRDLRFRIRRSPTRTARGPLRPHHRRRAGLLAPAAHRRASPGRAGGRDADAIAAAADVPGERCAARSCCRDGCPRPRSRRSTAAWTALDGVPAGGGSSGPAHAGLARRVADEALAELGGDVSVEYKLDGARIQVHRNGDEVHIFTRTLREITEQRAGTRRTRRRPAVHVGGARRRDAGAHRRAAGPARSRRR